MVEFYSPGRMISATKKHRNGCQEVWNANICTKKGKIWYGDLELVADAENLKKLATTLGETIYVLREMDARFNNEEHPLLENAVATFSPD